MGLLEELTGKRPPSRIYHYTSQAGLIGIVKNKSIWATSIHHLNDSAEFAYAIQLVNRIVEERSKLESENQRKSLRSLAMSIQGVEQLNIFVACFSEKADLLSQWRAYCPNGNGYAIGFKYEQLEPRLREQDFFLAPCIYDTAKQSQLIGELVDSFVDDIKRMEHKFLTLESKFLNEFLLVGPVLKDPSFAEEAEWRIVSTGVRIDHPQVKVREGRSMLLPYFEFKLADANQAFPTPHVVVGPTPHMELAMRSVQFLLGSFAKVVVPTKVPFRGW